jgi:hypothetical protein
VAHWLWFDAMKEKIVSHRITLAASLVVAVACLFVAGMSWQMSQQNRDANGAILDKLSFLATQQQQHQSLDWNPMKVRLVTGSEEGPPAVGVKARLDGAVSGGFGGGAVKNTSSSMMPMLEEVSDADGYVDFGLVRYGTYHLSLVCPWQESGSISLTVRPGQTFSKTIVCPTEPEKVNLALQIDMPEDLKQRELWVCGVIGFDSPPIQSDALSWQTNFLMPQTSILVANTGMLFDLGPNPYPANFFVQGQRPGTVLTRSPLLQVPGRRMKLSMLHIITAPQRDSEGKFLLPNSPLVTFRFGSVSAGGFGGVSAQNSNLITYAEPRVGNRQVEPVAMPTFDPKPDGPNLWKIALPDEMIAFLRDQASAAKKSP